jgi:ADP-heptose:LPS heptosyltransferase
VLILRGGALGDFIVTLPTLATLRRAFPSARLELAGNAVAAALAVPRGLLDAVHSQHEARWSALYGSAPLPSDFAAWLGGFDLVLSFWPDPDGALATRFPVHPQQRFLSAPALPPPRAAAPVTARPAAAHYAAALDPIGLSATETWLPLRPLLTGSEAPGASAPAPTPPRRGLVLHPGSGSPRKNWPLDRWLDLLSRLPAPPTVILGEAESGSVDRFAATGANLLVRRPLEELVDRLAGAAAFLGHDSGIAHLAAACGTPSLLLFGPTDPAVWAPPAPHVRVLRPFSDLRPADILAALAAFPTAEENR